MDTTLAVNPGSASKKYALYTDGVLRLTAHFERTGEDYGKCIEINGERQRCEPMTPSEYRSPLEEVLSIIRSEKILSENEKINRVAIRVVAPGTYFQAHRKIDEGYVARLRGKEASAPLHVAAVLEELASIHELLGDAVLIGVSDSAFHSTIPEYARTYSIPINDSKTFDLYRFGYHGLSVGSVAKKLAHEEGMMPKRLIVCHIGSGVSVTALMEGKSVETSMGFAPASGLMMGTRAGNLDSGALLALLKAKSLSLAEAETYLNHEGGLRGMLGEGDLRIALERRGKGDARAVLAVDMYMYAIRKQIGASIAVLGGLDALVLTATAAERNPTVRALILAGLEGYGARIDTEKNDALTSKGGTISTPDSSVRIVVMHTDEMREMADIASTL